MVQKERLDLHVIFKAVASLGGYESVTFNRSVTPIISGSDNPCSGGHELLLVGV